MSMNITATNVEAILQVETLFPAGFALENFSDKALGSDAVTYAETRMGVDGKMVAGYVPAEKTVTVTLEPCSESYKNIMLLINAQESNKKLYACSLTVRIPSINACVVLTDGVLASAPAFPEIGKTVQAVEVSFKFRRCFTSPI